MSVYNPVLTFSLIVDCSATGIVPAKTHARLNENTISLMTHYCYRCHVGDRDIIKSTHCRTTESAAGCLNEMIAFT